MSLPVFLISRGFPKSMNETRALALRMNDEILIQNCPPVSARKRFRLLQVLRSPEGERERDRASETGESKTTSTPVTEQLASERESVRPSATIQGS